MKFVFISLLLISWLTLGTCPNLDISDAFADEDVFVFELIERVPVPPNITVYQQVDNRDHVIVMCTTESGNAMSSCDLSVKTERNYTLDKIQNQRDFHLFVVTVNAPVSFTCMCNTRFNGDITYSETYIFNGNLNKDSDYHGEGVSLVYIGFVSFIALGLIIMITAVIVTIKSKNKGPNITVINNDYVDG